LSRRIGDVARFEDASLVLNRGSWETHFLNPEAVLVLDLLQESARSEAELARELLDRAELEPAERLAYLARLHEALTELQTLGLVVCDDDADR
jgi:PqqD family protein of HPr-rel-A system